MSDANLYRAELPDGTRIERSYRVEDGEKVPRGNWQWVVYNPDRRPSRKRVNLRTRDKGAAMQKALGFAKQRALGALDPWAASAAVDDGVPFDKAVERYLAEKRHSASRRRSRATGGTSTARSRLATRRRRPARC